MSRTIKNAYTGSKKFSKSCRNSGNCPYCRGNRVYSSKKRLTEAVDKLQH